jgi:hypothetical protein
MTPQIEGRYETLEASHAGGKAAALRLRNRAGPHSGRQGIVQWRSVTRASFPMWMLMA